MFFYVSDSVGLNCSDWLLSFGEMIIRNSFLVRLGLRQSRVLVKSSHLQRCLSTEPHLLKSEFPDVHIPQDVSLPSFVWDHNAEKHSDRIAMVDALTGRGH